MAEVIDIRKTDFDEDFRRKVRALLDSAKREVVIITGEGSSFGFLDLRSATERAIERGVRVSVYTTNPVPEFLNKSLMLGCKVYQGKETARDHFFVVDGRDWVASKEHPPKLAGERYGRVHLNDRKGAKEILSDFSQLIEKAKRVKTLSWDSDPLVWAIKHPESWGMKTDAKKFREEMFG